MYQKRAVKPLTSGHAPPAGRPHHQCVVARGGSRVQTLRGYSATKFAVEGLSASVALEVEPFGIKVTVAEPGFFRTGMLDPSSVEWGANSIEDYGAPGSVQAEWQPYDGTQRASMCIVAQGAKGGDDRR